MLSDTFFTLISAYCFRRLRTLGAPNGYTCYESHIKKALKGLEKEPPEGDIVPVVGEPGRFRLTVGSYRALFRYRNDHIFITHLDPRGQVYNKKNKGAKR